MLICLGSVRVLGWFSSTHKEFGITLWYNIVELCWRVTKMMLVYYCEVDEESKDSGMLKGTYPEKYDLWIHKVPTKRDNTQIRTTSPLSHVSDKPLCSLETTKQRREPFSWVIGCDFGWCQRSWGSFSPFLLIFFIFSSSRETCSLRGRRNQFLFFVFGWRRLCKHYTLSISRRPRLKCLENFKKIRVPRWKKLCQSR